MPLAVYLYQETLKKRPRCDRGSDLLLVFMPVITPTGFDDVERETALQFHAGSTENGAERTRSASLLADDLPNIAGRNVKAENRGIRTGQDFDLDRISIVHEGPSDFSH